MLESIIEIIRRKHLRPSQVMLTFKSYNVDGKKVSQPKYLTFANLYNDWYGECNLYCPANDAELLDLEFYFPSDGVTIRQDATITFGDMMDLLEKEMFHNNILKITETNVDGCGGTSTVFVESKRPLAAEQAELLQSCLSDVKSEHLEDDYDTEDFVNEALERFSTLVDEDHRLSTRSDPCYWEIEF